MEKSKSGKNTAYMDRLDANSRRRYEEKLSLLDLETCPYQHETSSFVDNMTLWPEVTYADMIDSVGIHTRETMRAYKSLDSYNYFISGLVHTLLVKKLRKDKFLFRTEVKHGQKSSEPPCRLWLAINKSGDVIASHCDCMAGLGEVCSHVAAALFKIEACIRHGYNKESCTSVPCKWNATFSKKVEPAAIVDIDFSKPKRSKAEHPQSTPSRTPERRNKVPQPPTNEEQEAFFQSLVDSGLKSVVLTTHDVHHQHFLPSALPANANPSLPLTVHESLFREDYRDLSSAELLQEAEKNFSKISVTKSQAEFLEKATILQADSIIWHTHRQGRITASKVYDVCRTSVDTPSSSLLKSICTNQFNRGLTNVPSLRWGIEHEQVAVEMFEKVSGPSHNNMTVTKCGMTINPNFPYLAASPDRLIECDCCGKGVLEIKCPYSLRDNEDISVLMNTYTDGNTLKKESPYYSQLQLQMSLLDVDYCYLEVWTPKSAIICKVLKSSDWFKVTEPKLQKFFKKCIMPMIMIGKPEPTRRSLHYLHSPEL